ncbi:tetratricopeptide repeat protein [Nitrospira sp. NS4]|uniref:tetratricopeptide repeat protein n=1 Tax=Nitrospira sp. NS4 TaxID=3414498 RepID=UPI003C2AFFB3
MKQSVALVLAVVVMAGSFGCGGPEERKAKYRLRAQEYFQQGNYPKARVALRNVLKIDPKDAEAYFLYAQVEEKERNWRNAVADYQQVVELNPDHDRAWIKLGKYYLEARALDMVGQAADRVLAGHPGHVGARSLKIAAMAVGGRVEEAITLAEQLQAEVPADMDPVLLLASLYTARERTADAVPVLRQALDLHPESIELLDALAMTYMRGGKPAEADATLQRIIALEPKILDHRLRHAAFYDQQQQYDKAEAVLKEAIRLDPENETRRLALVEYVAKRRGLEQAEASLLEARKELPRAVKLWFALGGLYESTQRADKARETYQAIQEQYQKKPEGLEAQVKLAGLDWAAGKTEDAERRLQDVLKENSRSAEALLLRGRIALQRGNGKDATQDFRSVLKDQPESADGYLLLGRAYLMTGETTLARESLDKAVGLNPGLTDAQTLLARLDASAGRIKEARQRIDALAAKDPGNVALLGLMFQLQAQEKEWGQSRETLTKLRAAGADQAAADLAEGHLAVAQQQWERAEAAYVRAAEQRPLAPEPLLALVQLGMNRGQAAQTQARLEALLAAHPGHPYADGFLGEVLLVKGDPSAAMSHFEAAARLNPTWATPWVHLARSHYAAKRMAEGDTVLLKGVEAGAENEQLRLLLATSLGAQRRYEEAIGQYEAVLQRNPKSLLAANNLAALLIDQKGDPKSLERALELSRPFESAAPSPYLLDTLGWAHLKLGHGPDAVRVLKQAAALVPDHPVLNYHLGAAYSKTGQRADAIAHLKKAVASGKPFDGLDDARALLAEVAG